MPPKKSTKKVMISNDLTNKDVPIIEDTNKIIPSSDDEIKVEETPQAEETLQVDEAAPSKKSKATKKTSSNTKTAKTKSTKKTAKSDDSESEGTSKKERHISAISPGFIDDMVRAVDGINLNKKDMKVVCEKFIENLVSKVMNGETVLFTNNMAFKRVERKARSYVNPKTNEPVEKPNHYIMTMSVKPALKKAFDSIEVVAAE